MDLQRQACGIVGLQPTDLIRGPGMPEITEKPMFNMKPNSLIYDARYDRVMEAPSLPHGSCPWGRPMGKRGKIC